MKSNLCFTKMVASGNDFIIIDNKSGELNSQDLDYRALARDLCRRRLSIGADGLLLLENSDKADFKMRIFNPDGSEVSMCGNGARCSALYASGCNWGDDLVMETGAGLIKGAVNGRSVNLKMSDPERVELDLKLGIGKDMFTVHSINTGVPHAVHIVDDLASYPVVQVGRSIRNHSLFEPDGTNVEFVGNIKNGSAAVRTYERGVEDETLACGTGAVATALVLGLLGYVSGTVDIHTASGEVLKVYHKSAKGKITDVYLEGTAEVVCDGRT